MDIKNIGSGPVTPIPEEINTVEKLVENFASHHADFYAEHPSAEFTPMLTIVCANGDVLPIMASFDTAESKDQFCAVMKAAFEQWGVIHYALAMEAWLAVSTDASGVLDTTPPSQRPDRIEVIVTTGASRNGNTASAIKQIHRGPNGEVSHLTDFEQPSGSMIGRFLDLFDTKVH